MSVTTPFSDLFPNYDPEEQLRQVGQLLDLMFTWRNELGAKLEEAEESLGREEVGTEEHMVAHAWHNTLGVESTYREAICSQASVATIAPFVEGLLDYGFRYLRILSNSRVAASGHHRWKLDEADFWNPHRVSQDGSLKETSDIVRGTFQLLDATGLKSDFPANLDVVLRALFTYRNRSLHYGYEWPPEEGTSFSKLIDENAWNRWFQVSAVGGAAWVVYVNDGFVKVCLDAARDILRTFGRVAQSWGGRM